MDKGKSKVIISLRDKRWQSGDIKEVDLEAAIVEGFDVQGQPDDTSKDAEDFYPSTGQLLKEKCTTCNWVFGQDDREGVIMHYQSQWHRFNVRNAIKGVLPVTEEQFEELEEKERDKEEAASSSADEEYTVSNLGSSRIYFVHDDEVFSIYSCILLPDESAISPAIFSRSLDCAIFLLAGGHFAAAVFRVNKMVEHKSFHRYVVRAKQGGVQSMNDRAKSFAHSAGATLRRYNEHALREDIWKLLLSWSEHLAITPLIFIRCASYRRALFHDISNGGFDIKDPRLRTIPFVTKRPLLCEVRRVWERLVTVSCHGAFNDFITNITERKQKRKNLMKKKRIDDHWDPENLEEKEKILVKKEKINPAAVSPVLMREVDSWPSLEKDMRRELYTIVKENDVDKLRELISVRAVNKEEALSYLSSFRFSLDNDTFLHMAARNGCGDIVKYLLEAGCDPSIANKNGLVAYASSANKSIKKVFIQFRMDNPNKWNWKKCHIPEPVQLTDEQYLNIAQKKRERKQRRLDKNRMERDVRRREEEELAARAAFLSLSDREKCALAAEARLAQLDGGPRCMQCGVIYNGFGFEYLELRFCSPACVAEHRHNTVSL